MSIRNKVIFLMLACVVGMMGFGGLVVYQQQKEWIQKEAEWFGKDTGRDIIKSLYAVMETIVVEPPHVPAPAPEIPVPVKPLKKGAKKEAPPPPPPPPPVVHVDIRGEFAAKKNALLVKLKNNPAVVSMHFFRSPSMEAQYGPTQEGDKPKGKLETQIFGVKAPVSQLVGGKDSQFMEVSVPMLAESGQCLKCHKTAEGELLGGLTLQIRLDAFGKKVKKDSMDVLKMTFILLVFMVLFITSMLNRLVGKPIDGVVKVAEAIAQGHISNLDLKKSKDEVGRLIEGISKMVASLAEISSSARQMAGGDLSTTIHQQGELADSFNNMVKSLGGIVQRIRYNSETLGQAVGKIADIARQQSQGAAEQITEVESLQATMNELSQSAVNATGQSDAMYELAQRSLESVKVGREGAKEGVGAMGVICSGMDETAGKAEELKEKTLQIGKVLEIINDIAMETKILSVNASIEASKAGEMGKGFTVVASEIAKLAENVVQSTSTIKEINDEIQNFSNVLLQTIAKTSKSAEGGVEIMKRMDDVLEKILDPANKTATAAQRISQISKSQSDKNGDVLAQMRGISVKSNEFSRSAQNSAEEAERIKTLFATMEAEVARFKLTGSESAKQPARQVKVAPPTREKSEKNEAKESGGGELSLSMEEDAPIAPAPQSAPRTAKMPKAPSPAVGGEEGMSDFQKRKAMIQNMMKDKNKDKA